MLLEWLLSGWVLKMRILFVLENYIPHIGGVEVLFKNLTEGLVKSGHDISIVTHRLKGTKKFEKINGVKVYRVNCFHSRYWFTFLAIPKVLKLAKKADIIQTTTFNAAFPAWFASKILNKPSIITIMEVWLGKWKYIAEMGALSAFIHNLLERCIYLLRFDKYVSISKSTGNQLISIGKKKKDIRVIYCGVDYKHWNPKKHNGKKIRKQLGLEKDWIYLFTGRPGVSKGLEYLLKAVPMISRTIPNAKLLAIVSRDKAYDKIYAKMLKIIKELGIKDKVIMHNPVPYKELPSYVKAADCVVVPSLAEGFGFAAAEACAMGKPVVASDTTSLPEVVSGKYVLVKTKNQTSIAEGVIKVHNKKYSKIKLKRFTKDDNIKNFIRVYKEIIKN